MRHGKLAVKLGNELLLPILLLHMTHYLHSIPHRDFSKSKSRFVKVISKILKQEK